jgi:hypothetical protein
LPTLNLAEAKVCQQIRLQDNEHILGERERAKTPQRSARPARSYKTCDVTAFCDDFEESGEAVVDLPKSNAVEDAGLQELLVRRGGVPPERGGGKRFPPPAEQGDGNWI